MKDNIYLRALEIGYKNIDGISFNNLITELNDETLNKNERFKFHFNIWFYENFYNEKTYDTIRWYKDFANSNTGFHLDFRTRNEIQQHNNEISFLIGESISKYIEFVELNEARKSSIEARKSSNKAFIVSILSLVVALGSLIIPFIDNSKEFEYVIISDKWNQDASCEPNDSIKTKVCTYKSTECNSNRSADLKSE